MTELRHLLGRVRRFAALDWADDRGQVGGIEVLPFGVLIFVVGSLLVVNAWAVIDCKLAVDGASREAVRAYVEAGSASQGEVDAVRAADTAVIAHGRDGTKLDLELPATGAAGFVRCAPITITASYPVPAITLPLLGPRGDGLTVTSVHSEIIDPYRSDVPGEAAC